MRAATTSASDDDDAADEDEEPAGRRPPPPLHRARSASASGKRKSPHSPRMAGDVLPGTASWRALRDIFSTTKKKEFVGADGSSVALPFAAAGGAVAHSFGFDAEVEAAPEEEAPAPVPTKGTTGLWAGLDKAQASRWRRFARPRPIQQSWTRPGRAEKHGLQCAHEGPQEGGRAEAAARHGQKLRAPIVSSISFAAMTRAAGDCGLSRLPWRLWRARCGGRVDDDLRRRTCPRRGRAGPRRRLDGAERRDRLEPPADPDFRPQPFDRVCRRRYSHSNCL